MWIELLMFFGALVPTVLVGVPVALAMSRPGALRAHAARGSHVPRTKVDVARAYEPLDLGPDPVHWPSERAWPSSTFRSPDWPSASWNDEHFGMRAKKAAAAAATAAAASAPPPEESRRNLRKTSRAPKTELVAFEPVPPPAPILVNEIGSAPGLPNLQAPDRDEIEQLIQDLGLAGTVQRIIERTGWDFRKAAQHLARSRQR
jgi:hypothetical protein